MSVKNLLNKIVRWLCFTVSFSFVPFFAMLCVSMFWGYKGEEYKYVGEILFACIAISAESLRTLFDYRKRDKQGWRDILLFLSFATILFPAILYGGMLTASKPEIFDTRTLPVGFLITSFLAGICVQFLEVEKEGS